MSPALRHERDHVTTEIVHDRGRVYGTVEGWPIIVTGRSGGFDVKVDGVPKGPTFYGPGEMLELDDGSYVESISTDELRRRYY